ncbi:putative type IV pilus protein [Pectobacterium atrosepticum SCRI1043]|uniref:Type IV pilus protein n=1 Tax=Pectobacterium atrosepticum (strain SCRI 1043 / ATCC BAA-672) TaxID=218491 RepID=Q6D927_PECAS|nr:CpaF family protein [Pectobacterium atrosepticum]GKV85566.1 fimbriae assembly protein [Pectobacterium carotovorum subsp. carotovorum]AIA69667.1 pilus assembly protein CpaF [Pectobacterium atrosepticum]AIK12572.1 Flp pilus assembly ATPase TadA [Pectobacterium atrosepticum]ATY89591.1 CpaF family protein [Pectobacterium atrosepticum]KFX11745.1 pilus assembly protein CpaF [Pectobacterium atrosepticum]
MLIRKNNLQKSEAGKSTPQPAPAANVAELKTRPAAENRTQPAANTSSGSATAARQTDNRNSQRRIIRAQLYDQIDAGKAAMMGRDKLLVQIETVIRRICDEQRLQLSRQEEEAIAAEMLDEMTGIGPIQPLLSDDSVNDILVNGAGQVFVERFGKLELSPITFIDEEHVFNTAQRIAAAVGRRIDEASPMVDARLPDGSRVNVITYPLAIDGTTISIRKFMRRNLSLEMLAERRCMSYAMADVLNKAMQARVNVIVSGGTGAGKTTLLNALSQKIGTTDRIITIEDAAELQLQQEHVVRLETRPVSAEGTGRVDQRDLMRNALRMRPDRIILGEVRGGESFDMLQAMNTGHDGSLCTVHANTSRDAIQRLENMVMMANMQLPLMAIRRQIASAVHLIVQIERMRDGMRRVVSITEVCGMENEVIQLQDLFSFNIQGMDGQGLLTGEYVQHIQRPQFYSDKAHLFDAQ